MDTIGFNLYNHHKGWLVNMKQGIYEEIINKQILSKLNDISTEEFLIEKDKIEKQ